MTNKLDVEIEDMARDVGHGLMALLFSLVMIPVTLVVVLLWIPLRPFTWLHKKLDL